MRLKDLELMQFLPQWMRDDRTADALAYAVERQLLRVIGEVQLVEIYANIDGQPEDVLDELGWQLNIPEYTTDLPLETKKELIKTAILTHKQRGTVAAVERVVAAIFGDGWVEEWPAYQGEPYHFKVHTSNVSVGDVEAQRFEAVVASTQNVRSYLEAIIIETVVQTALAWGGYLHEAETIYI